MKVSVIIPFQGELKYLYDCMMSLGEQTFQDFEVILVCDHAEHPSMNLNQFPITVVSLTGKDSGVAVARNAGLAAAKGEFVYFLDCDDYIESNTLESFVSFSEGRDIVFGKKRNTWYSRSVFQENLQEDEEEDESDEASMQDVMKEEKSDEEIAERDAFNYLVLHVQRMQLISALGIMIRRDLLEKNQIRFSEDLVYYSDIPFLLQVLCKADKTAFSREGLYVKRKHNDPINAPALSQISNPIFRMKELTKVYRTSRELVADKEEWAGAIDRKYVRYYVRSIAPFLKNAESVNERNEIYKMLVDALVLVDKKSIRKSGHFAKKMYRLAMQKDVNAVIKKVAMHCRKQTLWRAVKSHRQLQKLVYRKIYAKKPLLENTVLLESFFGKSYSDSPKYVFEYLNQKYPGEYNYVWILNKRTKLPYNAVQVKRFSFKYFKYLATCKYMVFNSRQPVYFIKREGNVFLETWHGTPLKKLVFDMDDVTSAAPLYKKHVFIQGQSWDYLLAPNQFSADVFRHAFMYSGNILPFGYPRNDILHSEDKEEKAAKIRQKLGIPTDKKTILYAPTWRDDEYYGAGQYKFTLQLDLEKLYKKFSDEYVVILRTHYFIADKVNVEGLDGFVYNLSKYDDIAELYLISDVLITDYSSVFFDYANLKRPILFYMYDLEKYRDMLRGFYMDVDEELPGPILLTTDDVVASIESLDEIEKKYENKYDIFYEKYCGWEDGHSAEKVVNAVFRQGEMDM